MIIDVRDHRTVLKNPPATVWIVLSMEVAVELSGKYYLLVKYPYYALEDGRTNDIEEGHWYPPFTAFTVEIETFPPQNVGDLVAITDRKLAVNNPKRQLEELAHAMGLGAPELHRCGTIFEIKTSPTFGTTHRAYRIERYRCRPRGFPQIRHIVDPECLKGHAFIPLDEIEAQLPVRSIRDRVRTFLGKPLISNLRSIIEDKTELELLKTDPIRTTLDNWTRKETGFLILVDIAGFGAACQFASEHLSNMLEKGDDISARFRLTIGQCFQSLFTEVGISQTRFTGDGFIAGVPDRLSQDRSHLSTIQNFVRAYLKFVKTLGLMNERIAHSNIKIGSRIAVHYGMYKFGRIGSPSSLSADFDGDALIEVARTEAALSQFSKSASSLSSHSIALTSSAYERLKTLRGITSVAPKLEPINYLVKERLIEAMVGFFDQTR